MPRPCSLDLRMRVLREVEAGASRREAAECVEVSASSAIKWMQRLKQHLDEIVAAMRKRRIAGSRGAVWRFFERHNISFKKTISDGVAPGGVETVGLYAALGRERPSAFWWRVTP